MKVNFKTTFKLIIILIVFKLVFRLSKLENMLLTIAMAKAKSNKKEADGKKRFTRSGIFFDEESKKSSLNRNISHIFSNRYPIQICRIVCQTKNKTVCKILKYSTFCKIICHHC